jgi:hypothetical protein
MIFKLDVAWDHHSRTIAWSFIPQDERAEGLLERLGFRKTVETVSPLTFRGIAAVATGKMLKACGAKFQ